MIGKKLSPVLEEMEATLWVAPCLKKWKLPFGSTKHLTEQNRITP